MIKMRLWAPLCLIAVAFSLPPSLTAAPIPKKSKEELQQKALKLNDITGDQPIKGMILTLIEKKEETKKLLKVAQEMSKDKKDKEQPFNINATYILGRVGRALRAYDESEHFYRINAKQALALRSVKKLTDAYTDLIEVLYLGRKFKEAELACRQFLEIPGDAELERQKMLVLRTMIRTQAKQGKTEQALKLVDTLIKSQSEKASWLSRELKGWVMREAEKYKEAAEIYEDVIERIKKDDRLKADQQKMFISDVRYTLSGVYVDMKKIDKAAEHLQELIKTDEDNPTYYNDLGFIWADHDLKLDESEKLIRKALELDRKQRRKANPKILPEDDKDNAAYLDSLGWVLYKQKKYKEALEPLQEAVKQEEGKHAEIYDHLAETYKALGQMEKAIEAWKLAVECKPLSKRDEKRIEKIKEKLKEATKE